MTDRWARVVSDVLSPAAVAVLVLVCYMAQGELTWEEALAGAVCYVITPAVALLGMARRGGAQDIYDPTPGMRQWMLLVGTACYVLGYAVVAGLDLNPGLRWMGLTFSAGAAAVWGIDRFWKISIHSTGVGGGVVLLADISPELWPVWGILPLAAGWARWRRGAHNPLQLAAGTALGAMLAWLLRGYTH